MKRKALALVLCLAVILSVTLPGTLAVSTASDSSESKVEIATDISKSTPNDTTGQATGDNKETVNPPADGNTSDNTTNGTTTEGTTTEGTTTEGTTTEGTAGADGDPVCTCGTEDGNHKEDCPCYVAPSCTCGAEGETHKEDCPLYKAPEVVEDTFDVQQVYQQLLDCTSCQQMDAIIDNLTEEQQLQFSEEMVEAIFAHYVSLIPPDPNAKVYGDHAPDFRGVGPLVGTTSNSGSKLRMAAYGVDRAITRDAGSTTGGLQLSKKAEPNADGSYTITLEAFATGSQVTTIVKEGVDIVLMLDLSDYMLGQTTYTEVGPFTYSQLYENIQGGETYFAKDGSEYKQVRVTTNSSSAFTSYSLSYADGTGTISTANNGNNTVNTTLYQVSTANNLAKLNALKAAVTTFINTVHDEAPASRIAIVTFANRAVVESGTRDATDEALVTVDDAGQAALLNIVNNLSVWGGSSNSHYAAQNAVKIFQDVPTDSAEYNRQRVAVLFSAGVSGTGWETVQAHKRGLTTGQSVGRATAILASILKTQKGRTCTPATDNFDGGASWSAFTSAGYFSDISYAGCGATMYCVGLDIPTSGDPASVDMNYEPYKSGALANEYFWRTSSHRLNGTHIQYNDSTGQSYGSEYESALRAAFGEAGWTAYNGRPSGVNYGALYFFYPDSLTRNQTNGYYLTTTSGSASDLAQLTEIFKNIAGEATTNTSSSTTLTESAVVKDIIAPQFQLPAGTTAANITVASYDFTGKTGDAYNFSTTKNDKTATATISDGGIVSVTGFNFSENWCGTNNNQGTTTNHGAKLVISFTVEPKAGFLGGNNVYTNTSAGVYTNGTATEPVQEFERPQVNVSIPEITITAPDKNVYLTQVPTPDDLKSGVTIKCGDVDITDPSKLEDWQTEYVDIESIFAPAEGFDGTEDGNYTITATVSPKEDSSTTSKGTPASEQTKTGTGNIYVFTPELTYKDSQVWYGDTAPTTYDSNLTNTVWKHDGTAANTTTMGAAPTLGLTYAPGEGVVGGKIAVKTDIPVAVTVKIGTTDVTSHTSFEHTNCTGKTCGKPDNGAFWLHVNTCTLTITKAAGTNTTIGTDEYFVFNVLKDGQPYTQVTIKGTGSAIINELPVGTYSITEDTSVAWRYGTPAITGSGVLSSTNPTGTLTCTNTKTTDNWLNHFSRVINTYGKTEGTKD